MDRFNQPIFADKSAWLRPKRSKEAYETRRTRLLLAINDADLLGFDATKAALISLLQELER